METQGLHKDEVSGFSPDGFGVDNNQYDALIADWKAIPPMKTMHDVLQTCSVMLDEHPHKNEVMSVLIVFVEQMDIWQAISMGRKPSLLQMETMVTGEGIVLDMTNDWFARNKTAIDMSLMECRSAMTVVRLIRTIGDSVPDKFHEEIEIVWQHFVRAWDFIPWIMFVATGSVTLYSSIKVIMCRYVIDAKPNFIKVYTEFRDAK